MAEKIFQARIDILSVVEETPTSWLINAKVVDVSGSFTALDVEVNDKVIIVGVGASGKTAIDRYKVNSIVGRDALFIQMVVVYDEAGSPKTYNGIPLTGAHLIGRSWGVNNTLMEMPSAHEVLDEPRKDQALVNMNLHQMYGNLPTPISTYLSLTDTADSRTGKAKHVVGVNDAETADEYIPTKIAALTDNSDFPASYIGQALKVARVRADESGVEFYVLPSSMPASDVYPWAKAATKPAYTWGEITGKPTVVSAFTNDAGYLTSITKAQVEAVLTGAISSHTHAAYVPYTGGASNVDLGVHNLTVDTNSLFVDSVNHRVGIGTLTPSERIEVVGKYKQVVSSGVMATQWITNSNADQVRGSWDFYTNSAVTPDFFGKMGFKFEGGVNTASKHFQIHVSDSSNPKFIVNGSGFCGIGTISPSQKITVASGAIRFDYTSTPIAPSAILANLGSGLLSSGTYSYKVVFANPLGESIASPPSSNITITDPSINGKVTVTIPTSADNTVNSRIIYRTKANGTTYYYHSTIANNTATSLTDDIADASLGAPINPGYANVAITSGKIYAGANLAIAINSAGGIGFGINTTGGLGSATFAGSLNIVDGGIVINRTANKLRIYSGYGTYFSAYNGSQVIDIVTYDQMGNVGFGINSPTAVLHLKAGTATANTAPLKFTAGTLLAALELGALEFTDNGTDGHLYITRNVAGVLTRTQIV